MKRVFIILFLLLTISRTGWSQTETPEFQLNLHYKDAGGGGGTSPIGFGYDPGATDGLDPLFGEQWFPGPSPGGYYVAFELPGDTISSLIDIMQMPKADSFIIQYKFYLSAFVYPAVLSWDRSLIPPAVKGIWITPYGAPFLKMVDMTAQDSVTIDITDPTDTNYATNWEPAIITLYYNTTPHLLSVSDGGGQTGLLSDLVTYPNPMRSSGTLEFTLSQQASVIINGYDALGREVLHLTKNGSAGENLMDLTGLAETQGAILLRIDASSDAAHVTKSVMLIRE